MQPTKDLTLVIPDAHVEPGQCLKRFTYVNKLIKDVKPKRVVIIGDFVSMDSLSAWDKDKRRRMEGRRYMADISCGKAALAMMFEGVSLELPVIFTEGNHEEWVPRYLEYYPELLGTMDVEEDLFSDLVATGRKLSYVKYKEDWTHKGVSFTHVPIQESGRPVTGKTATRRALSIYQNSVVFGHTHKFDVACEHRHNAKHLNQAINVGCYFDHIADYAKGSVTSYWRGLVLLEHYSHNRVDITQYSLGRLKVLYS